MLFAILSSLMALTAPLWTAEHFRNEEHASRTVLRCAVIGLILNLTICCWVFFRVLSA
jgi:hypothetical protein